MRILTRKIFPVRPRKIYGLFWAGFAAIVISAACSLDPIGNFLENLSGPHSERVGPYLRITFNPGVDWYPAWSGDGTRILYSASGFEETTQGQIMIHVIPAEGGVSSRVSPVFARIDNNFFPGWFNNDNSLAYISFRGLNFISPAEPTVTIVESNDIRDFSENTFDLNNPIDFSISPDGTRIAYSDFFSTPVDSGNLKIRGDEPDPLDRRQNVHAVFSAIWYADFPPTGQAEMIEGSLGAKGLSWSPRSDSLVFSKDGYLYKISPPGGLPLPLFEGESPAWSPDGRRIACVIDGNIFVYHLSDRDRTQVTTEGGIDPAWSPDGGRLAFSWERNGNFDIYVVDLSDITPSP